MGSAKPASPFLNKRQKQSVGNLTKKNFYKIVVKIEAKHRGKCLSCSNYSTTTLHFVQFVGRIFVVERSNKNCCRAIEEWERGRGSWTLTSCCAAFLNYTLQIGVRPKSGTKRAPATWQIGQMATM